LPIWAWNSPFNPNPDKPESMVFAET